MSMILSKRNKKHTQNQTNKNKTHNFASVFIDFLMTSLVIHDSVKIYGCPSSSENLWMPLKIHRIFFLMRLLTAKIENAR